MTAVLGLPVQVVTGRKCEPSVLSRTFSPPCSMSSCTCLSVSRSRSFRALYMLTYARSSQFTK